MCTPLLHFHRVACRYRRLIWGLLIVLTMMVPSVISIAQPIADPDANAPGEFVASKPEDIVGIWETWFGGDIAYMRYNADGTSILASTLDALQNNYGVHGRFWFVGTVLHVEDKNSKGTGTYEIRVKTEGDTHVYLSFRVIEDPVRARAQDYERGMPRFDLSPQAAE